MVVVMENEDKALAATAELRRVARLRHDEGSQSRSSLVDRLFLYLTNLAVRRTWTAAQERQGVGGGL